MSANLKAGWSIYGPPVRQRSCGACKLCCTLVPVELHDGEQKAANIRCRHLRSSGCGIYETRPRPCWAWSCKWLFDEATSAIRRPDQSGYAIDPMLDTILIDGRPIEVIQVWCDPKRREAHRDPALRDYLAAMAERFRLPAIVRWGSGDGLVVAAPRLTNDGTWQEHGGELKSEDDMRARLAEVGAVSVKDAITSAGKV
jgi:Pyruvate/2-oxoacid:ferredoxin oxidoreductase delta subunit